MPLAPADPAAAAAWARATLPGRDTAIRFRWKYQDADRRWGGRGQARIAPPDSLRFDYVGPLGLGAGAAVVVADSVLWADPERNFRSLVPAVRMLWAGLGVARPPADAQGFGLTAAVLPFDNQTPEPALTKEVNDAVLEAFQGRLGLRPAAEANADAVVRGRVVRYESDVPLSFQPGQRPDVTRRQVQITVDVELFDQRDNKSLWQRQGLTGLGEYPPPQQAAGRKVALQELVNDLVY